MSGYLIEYQKQTSFFLKKFLEITTPQNARH